MITQLIHNLSRSTSLVIFLICILCSCETTDETEILTGRYETKRGTEYLDFNASGFFEYDLQADAHPTGIGSNPPYTGKYKVEKKGNIKLTPISVHLGLFQIHFSEDREKLFVRHRYSGRNSVLQKVSP